MIKSLAFASLLAATLMPGQTEAVELKPMAGQSISLSSVTGTAYYTVEPNGFQVVATLATAEDATPVRFVTMLQPGQRTAISVPRAAGESALEVEISRVGDTVHVNRTQRLSSLH